MNVTPLVDVVLVLLIIFMVITPLLSKQFWLHTPKKEDAAAPPLPPNAQPPVVLMVDEEGAAHVGTDKVPDKELQEKLHRVFAARTDHTVFFTAGPEVKFGRAMEVLDLARGGGAIVIAVITEPIAR